MDRALELNPNEGDTWRIRMAIEPRLKQLDSSISSVSKLVSQNPRVVEAVYDRAGLYALKGDKANALADLKSALAIRSADVKPFARQDERFKSLRIDPEFQKLTGDSGGNPVSLSPAAPAAGKAVTIQYAPAGRNLASASQIYLHLGWNNWNPVVSPDPAMKFSPAANRWEDTAILPGGATNLNCVFNDGAGAWDNNAGANWNFSVSANGTAQPSTP
ncbi:MAG: hypothetical protein KGJ60_16040 [Verrucomicrobiota bacterium]|nr:hypothetical protein [Verrucomicrobiota bacterium]